MVPDADNPPVITTGDAPSAQELAPRSRFLITF